MRKTILFIFISLFAANTFAQAGSDSLAYQLQRKKINQMLAQRTQKFGQYQQSLSQHTGIFGLQTKNDIRHSNDILMDINKTDDDIYAQVKVLIQMSVFQQKAAQDRSQETEKYNLGFMNAVNRLRTQNEQLKAQL